jgi:hypothetical protein
MDLCVNSFWGEARDEMGFRFGGEKRMERWVRQRPRSFLLEKKEKGILAAECRGVPFLFISGPGRPGEPVKL